MPNVRQPRSGSLQYWPRKRAKRSYARIRSQPTSKEAGLLGFAGYKAGMTHVIAIETSKHSHKKGQDITVPVTIIECPPLRIAGAHFYQKKGVTLNLAKRVWFETKDKNLKSKIKLPKKVKDELEKVDIEKYFDIRALVYTQPIKTSLNKKKPELFELGLGGSLKDKFEYLTKNKEKEINISSVFDEGDFLDVKSISKGKGFQGPVKRFGISIRHHKSEKSIRNPGSLGPWVGQGHIMWRVPHAGQMGYHQRTEYNKQLFRFIQKPEEINPKGGIVNYGLIKSNAILLKGTIPGAKKRLVILQKPQRNNRKNELPTIQVISTSEKQGK